ncbi:MAG: hypothetical protein AAB370_08850 [Verrucomicrobiota bacterium]
MNGFLGAGKTTISACTQELPASIRPDDNLHKGKLLEDIHELLTAGG